MKRRELLEWLGKGCVLALGGAAITSLSAQEAAAGLAFQPGPTTGRIYEDWPVRTVDRQNLKDILATWRLTVNGLVDKPKVYTFAEMLALKRADQVTDFHCVEGWSVLDVPWNGVHISTIVEQVAPRKTATYVTFHTIRGIYNESLPLNIALEPKTLLAYGVAGSSLPLDHGFPLRVVVPRLYGYKGAKFVERIEFTDKPVDGYWVKEGYPYAGEIPIKDLRPGKY